MCQDPRIDELQTYGSGGKAAHDYENMTLAEKAEANNVEPYDFETVLGIDLLTGNLAILIEENTTLNNRQKLELLEAVRDSLDCTSMDTLTSHLASYKAIEGIEWPLNIDITINEYRQRCDADIVKNGIMRIHDQTVEMLEKWVVS